MSDSRVGEMFGLHSGNVTVNEETALSIATLFACANVLSSSFAFLPWDIIKSDGSNRIKAANHPISFVKQRPHNLQSSFFWRKTLFIHAFIWGNGYAKIIRNGVYRPVGLKLYHPREVGVSIDSAKDNLFYKFPDENLPLPSSEVIHFKLFSTDGIMGRSFVSISADTLKVTMQARRFSISFWQNGTRLSGIIKTVKSLTTPVIDKLKKLWFTQYGGDGNAGKTAILDEGMDYTQLGVPPGDAQLLEMLKWSDEKICAMAGVPQHMAGILDRSTNNNIEHQGIEYVMYSLAPHVVNFEQECDFKLFRTQEYGDFQNKLNLNALLRADFKTRWEGYRTGIQNGVYSQNMVLELEDMNPFEGGDRRWMQSNMMPIDLADEILLSKNKKATPTTPPASNARNGVDLDKENHKNGHTVN